jgi:hypothetical protein
MKQITVRAVAATLASLATLLCLKSIAVLAAVESPAAMGVVVLPRVEVVGTRPVEAPEVAATPAPHG